MDRVFMIRSGKTGICYCGKCGKRQIGDRYNMNKHAQVCGEGIGAKDEVVLVDEGSGWGYRLDSVPGVSATEKTPAERIAKSPATARRITSPAADSGPEAAPVALRLHICAPRLRPIPGFTDRFSGIEWVPVFEVLFPAGGKNPKIVRNETGYEMDVLLSLIRAGRIVPISAERDVEVIRSIFPCIDIYSLQMFVHIYRNKGYSTFGRLRPATEKLLFSKVPCSEEWKNAGAGSSNKSSTGNSNKSSTGSSNKNSAGNSDKIPICAALYRYGSERYILQVILKREGREIVFLFSRGYSACSENADLRELFGQEYCLTGNAMPAITQFDKAYPEYHLAAYAARSQNILVPLLAADYHSGMELAAKSGATGIAESCERLSVFEKMPGLYRNLRDLFGVPVSVLRALNKEQVCDAVMARVREIFEYRPVFLQFDAYTASMMEFYMRADITRSGLQGIDGITALSDKQILQILRYLEKHPDDGHYYCDYMNACAQLGEYPYGITPDIPVREAHDRTVARIRNYHDFLTRKRFEDAVKGVEYAKLSTCLTEQDQEEFEKDPFVVTAPDTSDDLFRESENMHNCVRIYVDSVAQKRKRIYFLRRKTDPMKSFGTLEVSGDGNSLCQAKAFGNARLDRRAQKFLVKWCSRKGIRISTADISEVSYTA